MLDVVFFPMRWRLNCAKRNKKVGRLFLKSKPMGRKSKREKARNNREEQKAEKGKKKGKKWRLQIVLRVKK
jgi:hypothetical protein